MRLQNSFFAFLAEIQKSFKELRISDDLHNTFVMFMYALYKFIIYYIVAWFTMTNHFVTTYLPLPKINST
jgi:hypothetical protein